jgi:hypothetical protein
MGTPARRRFYTESQLSPRIEVTPEGYLVCYDVPIARAGELIYTPQDIPIFDKPTPVTRSVEELFKPETISSFEGKPVTITHPENDVDPDNWARLSGGAMMNVRPGDGADAEKLMSDLLIQRRETIDYVQSRKAAGLPCEVSLGYDAYYVQDEAGNWIQTGIIGNHVAIVQAGRCGSECAIHDHAPQETQTQMSKKKTLREWWDSLSKTIDEMPDGGEPSAAADADPMQAIMDRLEKLEAAQKPAADAEPAAPAAPADEPAADAEPAGTPSDPMAALTEKVDKLTAALAKLLGVENKEHGEVIASLDQETISRAEIIAPGIAKTADVKPKALEAAYATADGKKIIDGLLDGRPFETTKNDSSLFVATAAVMAGARKDAYSAPRATIDQLGSLQSGAMTCEEINKKNAEHYGKN